MSIACWIVVFSPQIIENFRRSSADGLSLVFLLVWLLGDIFNILGAVMQGVLPTITILAVYYTIADLALLGQCFYYRGLTLSDAPAPDPAVPPSDDQEVLGDHDNDGDDDITEESPLLWRETSKDANYHPRPTTTTTTTTTKNATGFPEYSEYSEYPEYPSRSGAVKHVDATHLSPTVPLVPTLIPTPVTSRPQSSTARSVLSHASALLLVCSIGIVGWYLSSYYSNAQDPSPHDQIHFNIWGQIFGYLCAILYLGSRIPQILLNHRRKSTDGVSILFFLFACVGNLTFLLSIFAYEPACAKLEGEAESPRGDCAQGEWERSYGKYVLANASWILGSAGTLLLDLAIFTQFWIYRRAGRTRSSLLGSK